MTVNHATAKTTATHHDKKSSCSVYQHLATPKYCKPVLDHKGLCICNQNVPTAANLTSMVVHMAPTSVGPFVRAAHVPYLPMTPGKCFPMCRSLVSKKLYIDDTSIAEAINLQLATVPAHDTYSPKGRMNSCGLAIPGCLTALQHRLRDMKTAAQA